MGSSNTYRKEFISNYSPIEAAIRWCELQKHEAQILNAAWGSLADFMQCLHYWPDLERRFDKILDAIANMELAAKVSDVQIPHALRYSHMHVKIRHIDLQRWMLQYYPNQRPSFLFNSGPTCPYSDELCPVLMQRIEWLNQRHQHDQDKLQEMSEALAASEAQLSEAETKLSMQSEPTNRSAGSYLRIIAVLLNLIMAMPLGNQSHKLLKSNASIIEALISLNPCVRGLSRRSLEDKFKHAHRSLKEES